MSTGHGCNTRKKVAESAHRDVQQVLYSCCGWFEVRCPYCSRLFLSRFVVQRQQASARRPSVARLSHLARRGASQASVERHGDGGARALVPGASVVRRPTQGKVRDAHAHCKRTIGSRRSA